MADLNFRAQIELIDRMTAPMRSLSSQAERLGRQFGETANQVKKLQGQQRLIDSFRQQKQAMSETSNAVQQSRMRLQQLQQQMSATAHPSAALVRQFEAAGRESERLNHRLTSQRQHLQQLRGRLSDAGISTNNLADHERDLARQIERTNQQLAEQRRRMQEVQRLQRQSQQIGDMRNKAVGLAMGGTAATYAGARFIQPGLDLETSLSKVQALTRLDKNSPQYQALVEQAKHLGATTQFTSADAANGQAFLAMAGFTPQSIRAAMPGMLDLALAGGIELDRTADIASNILSGMKLDPKKMGNVADVLSGAFTRSNTSIEMLGETMKYAAPGAAGLNVSLEQVAAMAGKLGDAGIQGSMGGTALRAIMSRLAAPPKAAAAALEQLNIQTMDANGNLRQMPDILKELDEKTKSLGNTERLGLLKAIAGEEAGSAMQVLVDQAGSGALQTLIADLQQAQGEAGKLASTMADNTTGDFKGMTSAIDALRTSIFEANREGIRNLIQNITALTLKFTAFANAHPQLMGFLGTVFGILAIGATIIGGLGAVMLTILGPMALLRASLITLGLPTTLTPIAMLGKAIGMIGTVIKTVGMAMMANPILIAITLLAVAAYLIYQNWGPIKEFFINLWNGISAGATALGQWLSATWHNISSSITNTARSLWQWLQSIFRAGVQALLNIIRSFSPVGSFRAAFAAVWSYLSGLAATFRSYGANMLEGLKNGILGKAQAVIGAITGIAGRIKNAFTGARGMDIHSPSRVFAKYGGFMMEGLGDGVWANLGFVTSALNNVVRRIQKSTPGQILESVVGGIADNTPIQIDSRKSILPQSLSRGSLALGGSSSGMGANITININGAADPMAIANEVKRVLAAEQRNQMARQRSRLSDID